MKRLDPSYTSKVETEEINEFLSTENVHRLIFHHRLDLAKLNMDLQYKVLVNCNEIPFITSDNPVVRYNCLMEKFNWDFGSYTSNGWIGVKIFVPLNYKYSIIFFDATTYKVGNKKDRFVEINPTDVDQLNILQILNCNENLYFDEKINKKYIDRIITESKKYQKGNQIITQEFKNTEQANKIHVVATVVANVNLLL